MSDPAIPAPPCPGQPPPSVTTLIMHEFIAALAAATKAKQKELAQLLEQDDAEEIPIPNTDQ